MARRRKIESRHGVSLASGVYKRNAVTSMQRAPETRWRTEFKNGHILIFSDCHFWPGDRTLAFRAVLELAKELKPKMVIANGDVIDGATTSRHQRLWWDNTPKLAEELVTSKDRLDEIRQAARGKDVLFRWNVGNHDNRLDGWIANKTPELEGVSGTCLQDHFPEWPMAFSCHINAGTPSYAVIKHRLKGGINAVRSNTLTAGCTMVTGHLHQLKVTSLGDYNGRRWGMDTGTLADFEPPAGEQFRYTEDAPLDWGQGFGILKYTDGVLQPPELCEVSRGHAYFRGERVI